ncbi:MAG: serine--tRNA ligase, partial [Candidatus Aenigmarchaeota archaeon]|nr:serine--tRNA ligase [Candidatus Aenigmarchaeota archaeon]
MLDIKLIRENSGLFKRNLQKRGAKDKLKMLEELIIKDKKVRKSKFDIDKLKAQRNKISKEIGELKKAKKSATKKMKEASNIPKNIKKKEEEISKLEERIKFILMRLPNLMHESVPKGKDDSENVEIRKWGNVPKFKFEAKDHLTLLRNLDLIDTERAAKVAGHGFHYLKNELVILDRAIISFTIDYMMKKGFTLYSPPYMVNKEIAEGSTDLQEFNDVIYKIENHDLYLNPTAEFAMLGLLKDEVLNLKDLPLKVIGVSPSFRKEVGTHGKYTKGLYRMHQFNKVEQVVFCKPEDSWEIFEELQKTTEEIFKKLEIPYRVVNVCTGDLGIKQAKQYDIEGWMVDGIYRERTSCSNCTDFQARRLNIRYREKEGQKPKDFVHILNNTAIATSRAMVSIVEVNQKKDGTV